MDTAKVSQTTPDASLPNSAIAMLQKLPFEFQIRVPMFRARVRWAQDAVHRLGNRGVVQAMAKGVRAEMGEQVSREIRRPGSYGNGESARISHELN
jgi:hypothetical protein